MFAAEVRRKRVQHMRQFTDWRSPTADGLASGMPTAVNVCRAVAKLLALQHKTPNRLKA
jgi:hypothetical protein